MILISEGKESRRQTERERRERERLDTDTRILCAHVYTCSLFHTIKDILTPTNTEENACV
jgi:hypothetical protein